MTVPRKLHHRFVPRRLRGKPIRNLGHWLRALRAGHGVRTIVFVGQPKAGTTWVWKMLLSVPPYRRWVPRGVRTYEDFGSDSLQALSPGILQHAPAGCTVVRVHSSPTESNVCEVRRLNRPYLVMNRDPRDIAVSWAYYIEANPGVSLGRDDLHERPVIERLRLFTEELLDYTVNWSVGWLDATEADGLGLLVRYEELLADSFGQMRRICNHLKMAVSDDQLAEIVRGNSFRHMTGRDPGTESRGQHNRKGIAGDWVNHFDRELLRTWEKLAGDRMARIGYPIDLSSINTSLQPLSARDEATVTGCNE